MNSIVAADKSEITIKDGDYTGVGDDAFMVEQGSKLVIYGGTFAQDPTAYLADGYKATQEAVGGKTVYKVEQVEAAEIDGTTYSSLQAAIDAVQGTQTVKLLADVEGSVTVPADKNITLNLNGKKLSLGEDCIRVNGTLNVIDSGDGGVIQGQSKPGYALVYSENGGSFTVESGTIKNPGGYGVSCTDGSSAQIRGGVIESLDSAFAGNNQNGDMRFTVSGGTLTAQQGPAIYMPGQVNLDITGGTLNGGISLRMGQVNISGGTINAMTDENSIDRPDGNVRKTPAYAYSGNVWFPDALYVIGGTYTSKNEQYGNSLKLNITGGTFNCDNGLGSAVAVYDLGKVAQEMDVSISGSAKLSAKSSSRAAYQVVGFSEIGVEPAEGYGIAENVGKVASSITGGTFSSDPSKYVAAGYVVSGSEPYTVSKYVASTPTPTPEPKPEPTPVAPGTDVSGTDDAGNAVDATVTDNSEVTLPDGTKADGSAEYKGTTSAGGTAEPATEVSVPSTVTTSDGSTYVVTKIADEAFAGQEQLSKVTIPETVVEIGDKAFANTSIESVVIPAATTTIGAGVFQGCDDLKSVDISKAAITEIPADAFNGTSIGSIEIPAAVTSVGERAFKGTALTAVELPKAVKVIAKSTFENCTALKSVTTSATSVGYKALAGCTSLKSVDLGKVTELGKYAMKGDSKLKTVTTGAKLKAIGYKALAGTKVRTLTVSSKRLTSASVKGSLKGSSVKKVEVAVSGSKKTVAKYVAKYKRAFKKGNSGKSVKVVAKKAK